MNYITLTCSVCEQKFVRRWDRVRPEARVVFCSKACQHVHNVRKAYATTQQLRKLAEKRRGQL